MRDLQRAIAVAARADADDIEYAYWSAVADGVVNTRSGADRERVHGALRLLTLALLRVPDLTLQSHLLDVGEGPGDGMFGVVLHGVCERAPEHCG